MELLTKINEAPLTPGCYIYKDAAGKVIYVGKAVNIRNRVKSYFQNIENHDAKTFNLVQNIVDVEFVSTDNELEALLLETNLIKKYRPKYNILLKDDKNYSWLMYEEREDFPKLSIVREKRKKNAVYLGPFPDSRYMKRVIKDIRKVFPYRTCTRKIKEITTKDGERQIVSSDPKPCLYYYIGLCQAPCAGKISRLDYRKNINSIKSMLNRRAPKVMAGLEREMKKFALAKNFEEAAKLRDRIADLKYISQRSYVTESSDELKYLQDKKQNEQKSLEDLLQFLKINPKPGFKIECYDISNIQGTNAVGSMVVFVDGQSAKNLYRKFKIKNKSTPDDFAMMREVFTRRFKRADDKKFGTLPDLIVVDGGKGQLSSALEIANSFKIDLPIVGLAKRYEEVIFGTAGPDGKLEFSARVAPLRTQARYLLQRIRDEAHRYGLAYHRKLRSAGQLHSELEEIQGIGKVLKKKLYQAFGSLDGIRNAKLAELQAIVRNKKTLAILKKVLN